MGLIAFWIKGMLKDIKKIDRMEAKLTSLNDTVKEFSGELKGINAVMATNSKEIAVLQQSDRTQWKKVDEISQSIRDLKI